MMKIASPLAVLALAALAGSAWAQETTVKFGLTRYDTHSKTSGVTGVGIPAGADATTGDANTVVLTGEREVLPNLGVELVLGVPPKIKTEASGSVAFLGEVLESRNFSPVLFANYHFGEPGATWRPYIGLGVNYTKFTHIKSNYGWDVSLSDSWGWAAQVGVDWMLDKNWGLFASYAALKVKTDMVATGATVIQTSIDLRPRAFTVGVSYRF